MLSPLVNGIYKGFSIALFTSEHELDRAAGTTRKMTAIEVELQSRMPMAGAVASGGMVQIVQGQRYSDETQPSHADWSTEYIARSEDRLLMQAYLTDARVAALTSLMKKKNIWVIFVFRDRDTILRIDRPDPLENLGELTKTIDQMIEVAEILELEKGEEGKLQAYKAQNPAKSSVLEYDDKTHNQGDVLALELEEDEESENEPEADTDTDTESAQNQDESPENVMEKEAQSDDSGPMIDDAPDSPVVKGESKSAEVEKVEKKDAPAKQKKGEKQKP